MSATIETLSSYLPALAVSHHAAVDAPIGVPSRQEWPAALLFADISGFTALTEQLARRGPAGVEELSTLLNVSFGQILDTIEQAGGDVVKFAGDALLAVWVACDGDLVGASHCAAQCALDMHARLRGFARLVATAPIALRIGVAAGQVSTNHIGGVYRRWELLMTGEPLEQVGNAEMLALPGEVVLAPSVCALLDGQARTTPLPGGAARLEQLHSAAPACRVSTAALRIPLEELIRAYVPGAVLSRFVVSQTALLAELRRVSVIFAGLPAITHNTPLDQLQAVMETLQREVYRFEGSVNKIALDDKGATFMAAMGLPPLAHEDDAARALQAALGMRAALADLGHPCAIGVTTGPAFCGEIGSVERREYTMIGDVVNLAARLMQAATGFQRLAAAHPQIADSQQREVLCDEATFAAARTRMTCDALPPLSVKGKSEPVPVFAPRPRPVAQPTDPFPAPRAALDMVGREREQAVLTEQVRALRDGGPGGVVLIEGEAGMGKSRLLEQLRGLAADLRLTTFTGAGEAAERATPYYIWRGVFSQLFDLNVLSALESRRRHMLNLLEDEEDVRPLAPLLNSVLPLELPENEITARLSGQARAAATHALLLRLLQDSAERSPKLVILEDLHWCDSASWALTLEVARQIRPLLLVAALRPIRPADEPPAYRDLRAGAVAVELGTLTLDQAEALVCRRLGVDELPAPVAALIREKAGGHPFFSTELAYALRDTGKILVDEGRCMLAPGADLSTLEFPETVQGAIISRVDRLSPSQQLILKVASVIGRVFAVRALRAAFPVEQEEIRQSEDLVALERLDLIASDPRDPGESYGFRHAITQEVVYNLMLFAQRRQIHRAVAEWYERAYADDLSWLHQLLAHHWRGAGVATRAITYLEQAGRRSLAISAVREARTLFAQALDLLSQASPGELPSGERQEIALARLLGDTDRMLGNSAGSRAALERSLKLARAAGDDASTIDALNLLGRVATDMGDFDQAHAYLEESIALARAAGDTTRTATALSHRAHHAISTGAYDAGERAYQQSLEMFSLADDLPGMAQVLNGMGNLAVERRLYDAARYCYEESLAIRNALDDRWGQATCLSNLGWVAHLQGAFDAARVRYEASLTISRSVGDQRGTAIALNNLGFASIALHDDAAAARHFDEALRLAEAVGVTPVMLEVLVGMARLHARAGRRERAAELLGLALHHPACNSDVRTQADLFYEEFDPLLPPALHEAALVRGQQIRLEDAVKLEARG
ncbi:MAG TPA: tetratricopeptide repeat protein [Roseiflexaceae bacterium]|nr:tetratricopeptide repeat protein [Roseiflexaceae bacterium]